MNKVFYSSLLLVALVVATGAFWSSSEGATDVGNYQYEYVTSADASSTAPVVLKSMPGTLGHVIVGSSSSATTAATSTNIRIYDSASATSSDTLMAVIRGGTGENTFVFDAMMTQGVTIEVPANFDGNYTVTYR